MKHRAIFINGHLFASIAEASRKTHISPKVIRTRLLDPNNQEYIALESLPNKEQFQVQTPTRGPDRQPRVSGPAHRNWIHGEGKTRAYDSKEYAIWKSCVLRKDKYKCIVTGKTTDLTCHHLNSWDWYHEGRYDPENGVTITKEIHTKFHAKCGYGNNTKEQFERFLVEEYNINKFPWQNGNHEPRLTKPKMVALINETSETKHRELIQLISSRNHALLAGHYENSKSKLTIKCLKHGTIHNTTATNYKKSKTGMPCCAKEIQSEITSYHNRLRNKPAEN